MLDTRTVVYSGYADALFIATETGNRHEATQIMLSAVSSHDECQISDDHLELLYRDYDAFICMHCC